MAKNKSNWVIYVLVIALIGLGGWIMYDQLFAQSPVSTTTTTSLTTFTLYNANADDGFAGEDVSWTEISIWIPDSTKNFDSTDKEHVRPDAMLDYWKETVASQDADTVEFDASDVWGYWVQIDPDGESYFESDYRFYYGGSNGPKAIQVKHKPTDVYFSFIKDEDGTATAPASNGNYTARITGFPVSTAEQHYGTNWEITSSEYDDLSTSAKQDLRRQNYYRALGGTYDPTVDTDKDGDDDLELYTLLPAFRITMNDTISQVDGNVLEVNCSLTNADQDVEILIDGTYLYLVFAQDLVLPGDYVSFELSMGANITGSAVHFVELTVPDDDNSDLSATAYTFSI